ncbi:MAG: alanyl-tRNA editing protein [Ruminococcus sp.]|nr:alanyl-tRNA editing protein [Ruminococcus sp.]
MTERLYDNGLLFEFEAEVTGCTKAKKGFEITLDRSTFFPEGGGQAGDIGTLGGAGVLDTYEKEGEVLHLCDRALEVGSRVQGAVDRDTRLRRMQGHSGEHLLMGFIHRLHGLENVGFRLGSSDVTLDLDGTLTEEQLRECEQLANEAIAADVPITVSYPDSAALAELSYRSKLEMTENIRIVTIEGIDVCACCAPHLPSTGRIGMVKIVSHESNRGGTRVHIVCGLEALELFRRRLSSNAEIMRLLSAKPEETARHVRRLLEENQALKARLYDLERRRTEALIASLPKAARPDRGSFSVFTEDLNADNMRRAANSAVLLTDRAAGVFCKAEGGYTYIIASSRLPLRQLAREINTALGGRGGGSDQMIQGSVTADRKTIEAYFAAL